jgi:hypothetical protein
MIVVPNNKLVTITEDDYFNSQNEIIIEPLKGKIKRDWFIKHAYFCLPLTIGNQYGFAIKSLIMCKFLFFLKHFTNRFISRHWRGLCLKDSSHSHIIRVYDFMLRLFIISNIFIFLMFFLFSCNIYLHYGL